MEIAVRSEDHMNKHSAEILSNARFIVQEALMHNWCFILYDYLRLLGQFGLAFEESPRCHLACAVILASLTLSSANTMTASHSNAQLELFTLHSKFCSPIES